MTRFDMPTLKVEIGANWGKDMKMTTSILLVCLMAVSACEKEGIFCAAGCDNLQLVCSGNEPGWRLEFDGDDAVLKDLDNPSGVTGTYINSTTPTGWNFGTSHGVAGEITYDANQRCVDDMSGDPYDYKVVISNPYTPVPAQLNGCCRIIPN